VENFLLLYLRKVSHEITELTTIIAMRSSFASSK